MPPSQKVLNFCSRYLPENSSVIAAVSGGSDSVALIYFLHQFQEKLKIKKLAVAHVNHGLRGEESDEDEQYVREIAGKLNVSLFVKHLSGMSGKDSGIEQWARRERYKFFRSIKEGAGFDLIATGHTSNDQAETVLLRMLRGTGIKGLRGILPLREDGVIRPLLYTGRDELIEWLSCRNIPFRTDSSNAQTRFKRNSIRHQLMPALAQQVPEVVENLSFLAERSYDSWNILIEEINKWLGSFVINFSMHSFVLKKEGLARRGHASEGLKTIFERYGISATRIHVESVFNNAERAGCQFLLPGKWHYFPKRNVIYFCRECTVEDDFYCSISVPGDTECPQTNHRFVVTGEPVPQGVIDGDNWSVILDRECCT